MVKAFDVVVIACLGCILIHVEVCIMRALAERKSPAAEAIRQLAKWVEDECEEEDYCAITVREDSIEEEFVTIPFVDVLEET